MKILTQTRTILGAVLFLIVDFACGLEPSSFEHDRAVPLEAPAAATAQILAEGVISTELPEFATSLSPDGRTIYFNRMPADRSEVRIWSSLLENGIWSEPAPLAFSGGAYRDVDPYLSPDGGRLYFSSTRPLAGDEPKEYDLWYVARMDDGWTEPINLGPHINTANREIYSTVSKNGNLYFSVFESDSDEVGIFRSVWQDGRFLAPERLTIGNGTLRVTNPTVAPDESFLLFVSDHEGQADISISRQQDDGSWGEPTPLGAAVNSEFTEFAPSISPDGSTLFFTSERPGVVPERPDEGRAPGDIYFVSLEAALPPAAEQ